MIFHYFLISVGYFTKFFLYAENASVELNINKGTEDLIVQVRRGAIDITNFLN